LALGGPRDELRELADTFDDMLARLDAAFAAQRRFTANASHELRTPLTVMQTAIDVTLSKRNATPQQLRAMGETVRSAVEDSERLIEALLTLARADQASFAPAMTDLAACAEHAIDGAARDITARSLVVETSLDPAPVLGDPILPERMVANVVDNAVRHNVRAGAIAITTGSDEASARLSVTNSGDVIPEARVDQLFEPFLRLNTRVADDGLGLGLSIARAVAVTHRGTVDATAPPAGGLTVTISLPLARSSS
jgi:signal transduction histidine kinase